jgi:glutamine amidotransferase
MKNLVTIINYGVGNLDSIRRAIEECGGNALVTSDKKDLEDATHLILPGVGAFTRAMENIRKYGFDGVLQELVIDDGKPLLGICLGMQLLASRGWEGGETNGLDFIKGDVIRLVPTNSTERIPHIGWNNVDITHPSDLLMDIQSGKDFYFVHSYHFRCNNPKNQIALTPYCGQFTSIIGHKNIFGVQFHPEKSQKAGLKLLKNFISDF